jgi:hypothetical protein
MKASVDDDASVNLAVREGFFKGQIAAILKVANPRIFGIPKSAEK